MSTLILVTGSYPYSEAAEQTFLNQEVGYLISAFDRVIIVPRSCKGEKYPTPQSITLDETFARLTQKTKLYRYLASPEALTLLANELIQKPAVLLSGAMFKRLGAHVASAARVREWLLRFFQRHELDPSNCIFYTYWFDYFTTGIGLFKTVNDDTIRLVTRAHGADLFEERHSPAYIPCRTMSLKMMDALFPCMDKGTEYFRRYKVLPAMLQTSYLGTDDPGFLSKSSRDGVWRMVTCSFIVPLKRLDLLVRGIAAMAEKRPKQAFQWCHFGDGPMRSEVEKMSTTLLPSNVERTFPGFVSLEKIMAHYKHSPVDVFINVSSYEGQPVSIKEAISCGIPVVATDVGGNSEIVTSKNGILLNANPTAREIADALLHMLDHPDMTVQMSKESRDLWSRLYSSEVTYPRFVSNLQSIGSS